MSKSLIAVLGLAWVASMSCTSSSSPGTTTPAVRSPAGTSPATSPPGGSPGASATGYRPTIEPANFVTTIDNPFLPFTPGARLIYRVVTQDETQRDEVVVTDRTKVILGVTCVVVSDTLTHKGKLLEKTEDWYAQDKDGSVWYFGEATAEYDEQGNVTTREGSWESGVGGAQPGIIMPAHPQVNDADRQEYYKGHAEDMFWIVSIDDSVKVPYGSFDQVVRTLEWARLEPKVIDEKFYAPGIGVVREHAAAGGKEDVLLISFTKP
jgi:hypothetical protein